MVVWGLWRQVRNVGMRWQNNGWEGSCVCACMPACVSGVIVCGEAGRGVYVHDWWCVCVFARVKVDGWGSCVCVCVCARVCVCVCGCSATT